VQELEFDKETRILSLKIDDQKF